MIKSASKAFAAPLMTLSGLTALSSSIALAGLIGLFGATASAQEPDLPVLPDLDASRTERLDFGGERFRVPPGFAVEQVVDDRALGSAVNLTFDWLGRPLIATEGDGLKLVLGLGENADQEAGDDASEIRIVDYSNAISTAHGIYILGKGDLLVHASLPEEEDEELPADGTALYRLRDLDGDDRITPENGVDTIELVMAAKSRIQEHGPHTITRGPDGLLYILFGNMSGPDVEPDLESPLRKLEEDQLLPVLLDPRGHANDLVAPGGTVWRVDLENDRWELYVGGLRNPFDMAFGENGQLFIYEADMEWDRGLPWFRPTRVVHAIPAADFGWRTGSGKIAFDLIDTLPSVVDVGRGSPVGVAFYRHDVYPAALEGAYFMGDWSRGRIRVSFPERHGASYSAKVHDFVLGEPLNVTDLDVGPDGLLYFVTGGRKTSGGLYRVSFQSRPGTSLPEGACDPGGPAKALASCLDQPMPRSAWGRAAFARIAADRDDWYPRLLEVAVDPDESDRRRLQALELLWQQHGFPAGQAGMGFETLAQLLNDSSALVRARAARYLGFFDFEQVEAALTGALFDEDPLVVRRTLESLGQSGMDLERSQAGKIEPETVSRVFDLMDHSDRHVRWAARESLGRIDHGYWVDFMMLLPPSEGNQSGLFEAVLASLYRKEYDFEPRFLLQKLTQALNSELGVEAQLQMVRSLELLLTREPKILASAYGTFASPLLEMYPHQDARMQPVLERLLAAFASSDASEPSYTHAVAERMLQSLDTDAGRSESQQIATAYALRTIPSRHVSGADPDPDLTEAGFSPEQQRRFVAWFSRAWRFRGAASMRGYIELLWEELTEQLAPPELDLAEQKRAAFDAEQARHQAELVSGKMRRRARKGKNRDTMSHMSFEELAEYLEYDITAYERYKPEDGMKVFHRARCSSCHVFGDHGNGGGPDLTTVVKRLRRREILEAIMDPSKVVSDQYTALDIELTDGQFVSGMVVGDNEKQLTLVTSSGERRKVRKSRIASQEPARVSIMPEGLLDAMTLGELVSLMRFLDLAPAAVTE